MHASPTAPEALTDLIKGIRIAMLTTTAGDGTLRSRPMATQEADLDGTLWFFAGRSSQVFDDLRHQSQVNVAYADVESMRFVSVSGRARLIEDPARMQSLWREEYQTWFPLGIGDPDLALVRIDPEAAERWSEGGHVSVTLRH